METEGISMVSLTDRLQSQIWSLVFISLFVFCVPMIILIFMYKYNFMAPVSLLSFFVSITIAPLLPAIHEPYDFLRAVGLSEEAKLVQAILGLAWYVFIFFIASALTNFLRFLPHFFLFLKF